MVKEEVEMTVYTREEVYEKTLKYFGGDELATDAWINKYCLKENNDKLYESSPDDMHWRMAKEFARIEAKYTNPMGEHEIYEIMKNFRYVIPQGSPMFGIGNNLQVVSLSNCIHGESLVYTKRGLVKMKNVVVDDCVLTHKGRFRKVLKHWSNGIKPTYTIGRSFSDKPSSVRDESEMSRFLATTNNHEFYTNNDDWISMEDLSGKHDTKNLKTPYIASSDEPSPMALPIGKGRHLHIDKKCAWIMGMYLAEGSAKKRDTKAPSIYFTLNKNEGEYAERIRKFCKRNFNHDAWVQEWDGLNFIQVNVFEPEFAKLIISTFGHGFKEKRLPLWVFDLPMDIKCALLDGFMCGNATNYNSLDDEYNVFSLANPTLAYEIGLLFRSIDKTVRYNFLTKGKLIKNHTITTSISTQKERVWTIKSPIDVEVFDMEIEEDHSFVVGDFIVHNCFVIGNPEDSGDSYGAVCTIDQELVQLSKRRAGVGSDVSLIRPKGTSVKNAAITSTGVVPFMERYSNSIREVAQDGRRGALLLSISIEHPDAENFIDAKMTSGKVTGANVSVRIPDDFMEAVIAETNYTQQFPIKEYCKSDTKIIHTKEINAKKLWNKIMHNNFMAAEPGVIFWDTVIRESITDCYSDFGFKTTSTNPCLSGDSKVAVADGRGYITIKQLADEGKDIPVYCKDDKDQIVVRMMRHPRVTGYNQPIYKVTFDSGDSVRVTGNHKYYLNDKTYREAKDLVYGDSLYTMVKREARIKDVFKNANANSQKYLWIKRGTDIKYSKLDHRLIAEFHYNEPIPKGYVVHHKDYNALNNRPSNLVVMTKAAHDELHSKDMIGDRNPMRRAATEWSKEKWALYSKNMSEAVSGVLNGRYSGYTEDDLRKAAIELTQKLNRRFSKKDWMEYAEKKGLPIGFSGWRKTQLNGGILNLAKWAALELGMDETLVNSDPRVVETYKKMLQDGYDAEIVDNEVYIQKLCESCEKPMTINHLYREISKCCTIACSNNLMWKSQEHRDKVSASRKITEYARKEIIAKEQIRLYSELTFILGKEPIRKEWEEHCKNSGTSFEIGRPTSPIVKWDKLKEMAATYNHKVVSVELDGYEDVYNGTVDDFHNFFMGEFISQDGDNNMITSILNLQCGEITLSNYDSCRLLILNLLSYVINPFTSDAYFDYELFKTHSVIAQRMMDDIVDLELEKIDQIIAKIKSDPEAESIKRIELELWEKIKEMCVLGRRTGTGITAMGDMLAALGLRYGTPEATDVAENIMKVKAIECFRSSVQLAKERGAFPVYDSKLEENNPFIQRIKLVAPDVYDDMVIYGRRNISISTISPTGTTSMMSQTSSGIEPVFMVSYKRRRKINPNDKNVRVDFTDTLGDTWMEYNVFHPQFLNWALINGYNKDYVTNATTEEINNLITISPYYKAMANDVDWIEKVIMQAKIQKFITHSISVTHNVPNHVSEELINEIYMTAWKHGVKGCTIYRDGSRSGVLLNNEPEKTKDELKDELKEELFKDSHAPKRPKHLECDVLRFMNKGEKWIGFVGLYRGRPYEVFTGPQEEFKIPVSIEKGKIRKVKQDDVSRYDFVYETKEGDVLVVEALNNAFHRDTYDMSRTISATLRHGMPLPYVISLIESLHLDGDIITSWKQGVKRMLKKYIPDDTQVLGIAPNCPDKTKKCNLVYQESCLRCLECGNSKCG